jgi:hypothetical protein
MRAPEAPNRVSFCSDAKFLRQISQEKAGAEPFDGRFASDCGSGSGKPSIAYHS